MNRIILPDIKKGWTGIYRGDIYGSLWNSFNIDIDEVRGFISLSKRLYRVIDNTDDSDFDVPMAFARAEVDSTNRYWCLADSGVLFKTIATGVTSWQQDSLPNSPTRAKDDLCVYGGDLFVPVRGGSIDKLSGGTWTTNWWNSVGGASLTTADPMPLDDFLDLLLIGNGRYIHTWDGSVVNNNRLTLPDNFEIVWIMHTSEYVLIGAKNNGGGEARVFFWDGTSTTYNSYYGVGDDNLYSGVVVNNNPYIINGRGEILYFTGAGFKPIPNIINLGKVSPNGMVQYEKGFLVLTYDLFNFSSGTDRRFPDGIYYYNIETGTLTHRYSVSQYDGGSPDDYGQMYISGFAGAMFYNNGNLLVGSYYDYSGADKQGLFIIKSSDARYGEGKFITPKIMSGQGFGFYRDLILKFLKLKDSGYKITIKYRTDVDSEVSIGKYITWVNSNSFSSDIGVFDATEVEFADGDNAGLSAQITNISSGTPYIYTLDESLLVGSPSESSLAIFSNWKKLGDITDTTIQAKLLTILKRAEWIQFKIELLGSGEVKSPSVTSLILDTKESLR